MARRARDAAEQRRLLDRTFDITIILKGIDGFLEAIGGVLLLVVSPDALNNLALRLTRAELSRDPHDFVARRLLRLTADLHHTQTFGAIYLLSHGIVKIVLVAALLRQQRWAYPAMLAFLVAFIGYQCYRLAFVPSIALTLLTVFDLFVVWLTWREYQLHRPTPAAGMLRGRG